MVLFAASWSTAKAKENRYINTAVLVTLLESELVALVKEVGIEDYSPILSVRYCNFVTSLKKRSNTLLIFIVFVKIPI